MELLISSIADIIDGKFTGDGNKKISNVASFETATTDNITFAGDVRYIKKMNETEAGAIIVPEDAGELSGNIIYSSNPRVAFTKLMTIFNPPPQPEDSIDSSSIIGNDFNCGTEVTVNAGVVIGDGVTIGDRVILHPNVVLGDGVAIGSDVIVHPNVSVLNDCIIGSRVTIHSGSVIGSDGYGFAHDGEKYTKIVHIGIVRIGDDVELGANNTIDRGTYGETLIKNGVKTDNQVHIAHNVVIGENTLLVAQVGIAGSTVIGDNVVVAGKAGIAGHLKIGNNVMVGPGAGILKSVEDNQVVSGLPGMPHKLWLRAQNVVSRLPEMKKQFRKMEKRLEKLENKGE